MLEVVVEAVSGLEQEGLVWEVVQAESESVSELEALDPETSAHLLRAASLGNRTTAQLQDCEAPLPLSQWNPMIHTCCQSVDKQCHQEAPEYIRQIHRGSSTRSRHRSSPELLSRKWRQLPLLHSVDCTNLHSLHACPPLHFGQCQ